MLTQKQSETVEADKAWESLKGSGLRKFKGGQLYCGMMKIIISELRENNYCGGGSYIHKNHSPPQ